MGMGKRMSEVSTVELYVFSCPTGFCVFRLIGGEWEFNLVGDVPMNDALEAWTAEMIERLNWPAQEGNP